MNYEHIRSGTLPNNLFRRIAARLRFGMNVKSLVWAAARDGWR
jgi:hypothetical protein